MKKKNINSPGEPMEEMLIHDLATLKVLTDPKRLKIITEFKDGNTVKQVSAALDIAPQKLYYHVNMLEKHGLLEVIDENLVNGIVEKTYRCRAKRFVPADDMFADSQDAIDQIVPFLKRQFNEIRDDFIKASVAWTREHEGESSITVGKSSEPKSTNSAWTAGAVVTADAGDSGTTVLQNEDSVRQAKQIQPVQQVQPAEPFIFYNSSYIKPESYELLFRKIEELNQLFLDLAKECRDENPEQRVWVSLAQQFYGEMR